MWAYLSRPRYYFQYSDTSYSDMELTVKNSAGSTIGTYDVSILTTSLYPYLYRTTAPVTLATAGTYYLHWAATGYANIEELIVTEMPPVSLQPNILAKYSKLITLGSAPRALYIMDDTGTDMVECFQPETIRAQVTGTTAGPFTITDTDLEITFEDGETQDVTLTSGSRTVAQVVTEINEQIYGGRAIAYTGYVRIMTDTFGGNGVVTVAGDALTALGITAGEYEPELGDSPNSLVAISGGYETEDYVLLTTEGLYVVFWTDSTGVVEMEQLLVYADERLPQIRFTVSDETSRAPMALVDVLVQDYAGEPVAQATTNFYGLVQFNLPSGPYTVSLRRGDRVFSTNNFAITVEDPINTTFNNDFLLFTGYLRPQFRSTTLFASDDTTIMRAQIVDLQGNPIPNVGIAISNKFVPIAKTSIAGNTVGVMSPALHAETDNTGAVEVVLLRGVQIEVAVEGTSIRRTFTTPNQSEFNLLDYFGTQDVFDIIRLSSSPAIRTDI